MLRTWLDGFSVLVDDDLISFYTYFTMVLAEIAFLWSFFPDIALPFTILLLLSCINIVVTSYLKSSFASTKKDVAIVLEYRLSFVVLCGIGCFFNWFASIVLFAIPLIITGFWIVIRNFQDTIFCYDTGKLITAISKMFQNKVFWVISQIVVVGLPISLLAVSICTTSLPVWAKIILIVVYAAIAPFIALLEDEMMGGDVFELAKIEYKN